jgi:1-acyl-sn-glycerol-3-phosphate acyltransferase
MARASLSLGMIYTVLTWCARRALRWCYREVRVVGTMPARGPVLLAINHPNELADISVVLAHLPRRKRFVANATSAEERLVRMAYARMGVIAVHRVRDMRKARARGEDSAAANLAAFSQVRAALAAGECVCVFPEGGVTRTPHLGALRTGVGRMALDARDDAQIRGVQVVPVGITYTERDRLRSDVLVEIGAPIALDAWVADPSRSAAPQLTHAIGDAMRRVTCNAPDATTHEALRAITQVLGGDTAMWRAITDDTFGPGIAPLPHNDPRFAAALRLHERVAQAVAPHSVPRALRAWSRWRTQPPRAIGAPLRAMLGALGLLLHGPAWLAAARVARAAAPIPEDVIPRLIIPGLYVLVAWYALLGVLTSGVLLAVGASPLVAFGATALLWCTAPSLGDAAMRWRDERLDRALWRTLHDAIPDLDAQRSALRRDHLDVA